MRYEVAEDAGSVDGDVWRVEAVDYQSEGEVYIAVFSGPGAQRRAEEYAEWKNQSRSADRPSAVSM